MVTPSAVGSSCFGGGRSAFFCRRRIDALAGAGAGGRVRLGGRAVVAASAGREQRAAGEDHGEQRPGPVQHARQPSGLRSWRRGDPTPAQRPRRPRLRPPDPGQADRPGPERDGRPRALALAGPEGTDDLVLRRPGRHLGRADGCAGGRPPRSARGRRDDGRPPPERALDIGTGTGVAALFVAREFPYASVRGVDVSEEMIRRAKAKVGLDPEGRVAFQVADASSLPYGDGHFDLVTLLNMPPFFAEIARVLRHGGHAIVAASAGDRTPFYTPDSVLARGFRRHGMSNRQDRPDRQRLLVRRPQGRLSTRWPMPLRRPPTACSSTPRPDRAGRRSGCRRSALRSTAAGWGTGS